MEAIVANVDDIVFDIEVTLREQLGAQSLPFSGMDSECLPSREPVWRGGEVLCTRTGQCVL